LAEEANDLQLGESGASSAGPGGSQGAALRGEEWEFCPGSLPSPDCNKQRGHSPSGVSAGISLWHDGQTVGDDMTGSFAGAIDSTLPRSKTGKRLQGIGRAVYNTAMNAPDLSARPADRFATTHWSLVLAARERDSPEASEALATLCRVYWYPLYAHICRQGYSAHQAQDLTQEFFARLLERDDLRSVDQRRGKFRHYLLACLGHFLANEADRARAQKRGGGRTILSLDFTAAEQRYQHEPAHALTPEKLFERRWALTVLEQVLARLREEYTRLGQTTLFAELKIFLTGEHTTPSHQEVAAWLGMTAGAVKVAVHRLRVRYREMLREEIARTVSDPAEIDEEIRALFRAFSPDGGTVTR
jgi:RNA polymerase sigma-70 factor (ECF subfamily)